jgi:lipopolysaccharide transport protein LptA
VKAVLGALALLAAAPRPDAGARHPSDGGSRVALRRPVSIDSDRAEIRNAQKEASWIGHVKVRRDSTVITCHRMKVLYTETEDVNRILCDGNVEAVDGDKRMRGEHADYDNEAGILVMTDDASPSDAGIRVTAGDAPKKDAGRSARECGPGLVEIWNAKTHACGTKATFWSGEDRLELEGKVRTLIDEKQLKDGGR